MNNSPLVSVLIPAYNHEKYIQKTITSILNQSYKNIELIIVNDGSSDFTYQKMCEIEPLCRNRFSRVVFETQENKGTCDTLIKLINISLGEFIYFIASDDLAKPEAIEKQLIFLLNNPFYSLVVGDNEIIDEDGVVCYWNRERKNVYNKLEAVYFTFADFLQKDLKLNFLAEDFGNYSSLYLRNYIPNGYLIRKSIFEKINTFTKNAPLEDWYMMLQISKYSRLKYIDEILFSYRWHATNTIKQLSRMTSYEQQTRDYEEKILEKIKIQEVLPDVIDTIEHGSLYKRRGLQNIFEIFSFRRGNKKIKVIKIFGMKLFSYQKNMRFKKYKDHSE